MSEGIMYIRPPDDAPTGRISGAKVMEWTLFVSSMFWPRLFILGFWIFGSTLSRAFSSWIIPVAGFFLAPWTTLAYAFMWSISSNAVTGWEWAGVVVGVLLDVLTYIGARGLLRS